MLFQAKNASLTRDGVTVLSDLNVECEAERVALVGDWTALFDLLRGRAQLVRGTLELAGEDACSAVLQGKVGLACADADVNPAWTAAGYLERVALLDVGSRGVAKRRAQQALESLGLGRLSSRTLGALTRVERLAVALARASLSAPELIVLESGFDGLGVADANWLRQVIAGLVTRARLMVSFADLSGNGRHVVLRHDHCVLMFCGRVVAQGDPKVVLRPVSFLVTVTRHAKRLRDELLTLGCSVQADATLDDATTTQLVVAGGGDDLSDRIVQVAVDHGVPVIELLPVGIETSGETGA